MTTDKKNFDFRPDRGIITQNWISGCSLSVRHLVWDQGQAGSTPVTRTKNPLKLTDFRGLFFAYCGAGFEDSYMNSMKTVTWIRWLIVIFTKLYYNWLTVGLCATKAAVWVLLPCGFLYEYLQFHFSEDILCEQLRAGNSMSLMCSPSTKRHPFSTSTYQMIPLSIEAW